MLFSGIIGNVFYARDAELPEVVFRKIFARQQDVDEQWLETLHEGSKGMDSRWAVFSFWLDFGDLGGSNAHSSRDTVLGGF